MEAIDHAVPMPAIAASLFARFVSRQEDSPTMKAVAALRNQFGGHAVQAVQAQEVERPA
jgi:6-phosphogluconate dehydrogenase